MSRARDLASNVTAIIGWAATQARARWGIEIEARQREALHSALMTGAQLALARLGPQASQSALTAAVAAQIDPASTVRWKTASGEFVSLTGPQITAIAQAVRNHVQACFDREADLAAQIRAAADPAAVAFTF